MGGRRVKVVDIHAHAIFPEVAELVKDGPFERFARGGGQPLGPGRIQENGQARYRRAGGRCQYFLVLSDGPRSSREGRRRQTTTALSKWCEAHVDRFVALTSPANPVSGFGGRAT